MLGRHEDTRSRDVYSLESAWHRLLTIGCDKLDMSTVTCDTSQSYPIPVQAELIPELMQSVAEQMLIVLRAAVQQCREAVQPVITLALRFIFIQTRAVLFCCYYKKKILHSTVHFVKICVATASRQSVTMMIVYVSSGIWQRIKQAHEQ